MREEENRQGGKWTKRAPRKPNEPVVEMAVLYGKKKLGEEKSLGY